MPPLPNEIWRLVFSFFESTVAQEPFYYYRYGEGVSHHPELVSLSLVCRQLYPLAMDVLYRTLLLSVELRRASAEKKFGILRTLAASPWIRSTTRAVELGRHSSLLEDGLDPDLEEVVDSLHIPGPFKEFLKKEPDCEDNYGPTVPFLLLALTPKVKLVQCTYSLKTDIMVPWILGGHLDRETARNPQKTIANYLVDLEEVRLTDLNGFGMFDRIEPVLLHPNIRTLHLSEFDCTEKAIKGLMFPDQSCGLQKLVLQDCAVDAPFVQHILSRCTNLHSLDIYDTFWCQCRDMAGHAKINLDEYGQVLRDFGQNLVRFALNIDAFTSPYGITGKIGSLRKLKHLRHLLITKRELVGKEEEGHVMPLAEVLPYSLETLHFYLSLSEDDYHSSHQNPNLPSEDNDKIFALVSSGQFTNLRKLTFIRWGIPENDKFTKVIEGWDIQEKGVQDTEGNSPGSEAELVDMELVMVRKK
ncbi:hypothetical protein NW762_007596 [Fusarium torreyae]|uniref:F-box domain-containing protein n=1 Tax=Fusarium torreyae TaxID=1237075 RepID=A0A9W8S0U6_9HYPO|nr:hypothetical protein NW762_007596 [Fusarium torreyae]